MVIVLVDYNINSCHIFSTFVIATDQFSKVVNSLLKKVTQGFLTYLST